MRVSGKNFAKQGQIGAKGVNGSEPLDEMSNISFIVVKWYIIKASNFLRDINAKE